jgi:carboxynorspermidine decarboxylase
MDFSEITSPCFVLDESRLRQNLEILNHIRRETGVKIVVALKGFALWKVFPMFRPHLDGAAASSYYEARLCVEELQTLAHTYAVVYAPNDFEKILSLSSHITFNSLTEYQKYTPSVKTFKKHKISIGLRVNPEFSVISDPKHDPTQPGSRLGIDLNLLKNGLPKGVEGLHVHCLAESNALETGQLLMVLEEKLFDFLPKLKWLNLGGGHLLTQKDYDLAFLIQKINDFKKKYPHIQLILEPSTAIGFNAGILRTTVLDIVHYKGVQTLMLDVSFKNHLPDSLVLPLKPKIQNAVLGNEGRFVYQIGGSSGSEADFLPEYSFSKLIQIGDTVIFENAMNYTMVKTTFFQGVKHPSIGILQENGVFELIRQFGYADYKKRLG